MGVSTAAALPRQGVGVVTLVDGNVTRAPVGQEPLALKRMDTVSMDDRITIGPGSLLKILVDADTVVIGGERSALTITKEAGSTVIVVHDGALPSAPFGRSRRVRA